MICIQSNVWLLVLLKKKVFFSKQDFSVLFAFLSISCLFGGFSKRIFYLLPLRLMRRLRWYLSIYRDVLLSVFNCHCGCIGPHENIIWRKEQKENFNLWTPVEFVCHFCWIQRVNLGSKSISSLCKNFKQWNENVRNNFFLLEKDEIFEGGDESRKLNERFCSEISALSGFWLKGWLRISIECWIQENIEKSEDNWKVWPKRVFFYYSSTFV